MLTVKEYLVRSRNWKGEPLNLRGNPANKVFIEEYRKQHDIPTQGEALDYIISVFKEYDQYLAEINEENERLLAEKIKECNTLQQRITSLEASIQGANTTNTPVIHPVENTGDTYGNKQDTADADKSGIQFLEYSFTMFEDERLQFLKQFRQEGDKHPFETIAGFKDQVEAAMMRFIVDPLHILEGAEYEDLVKWDKEVFTPGMRVLTGIPDLELTGREKFLLMLDYVKSDPVKELPRIGLPDALQQKLEDISFPRAEMVMQILADKKLIDVPSEVVQTEKSGE